MSIKLSVATIIGSGFLSVFSAFKLWINDEVIFQSTSDIIMLISNLIIAGITTVSKNYIDDARNEKIKNYVAEVNTFLGMIYAQSTLAPDYRMEANKFFESHTKDYTKLMTTMPALSVEEMELTDLEYDKYRKTIDTRLEHFKHSDWYSNEKINDI